MEWKSQYEAGKAKLLKDESICTANRELVGQFFEYEEYKLKRQNGLRQLDASSYRTLYGYLSKLANVNAWFGNKPWRNLTRADIKRVYDDLEDGKILSRLGKPFEDRASYYNKIMKSKPFRLAQKSELAKDVIEFSTAGEKEVRFVTEETFRKMISVVSNPVHLLLFWLAWDIGENVGALLQLTKREFVRQRNKHTKEPEYLVNLPRSKIKRSRQARSEPTLYPGTVRYADIVLGPLGVDDPIFPFGHRQALKIIHAVARKTEATCMPNGGPVRWKDLRSGMACHLLRSGWSREEVDARLGHSPNSNALGAYANYLAIDRERPKKKLFDSSLEEIQNELEEAKRREKLTAERLQRQSEEAQATKAQMDEALRELRAFKQSMQDELRRMKRAESP